MAIGLQDWNRILLQTAPFVFGDQVDVFRSHHGPTTDYENAVLMQSLVSIQVVNREIYWNEINTP